MATLLSVVQDFCKRQNLTVPGTALGSTDKGVTQIVALIEEEGDDLASRRPWEGLKREASHTTVATEDQGAITTIADDGFKWIVNDTIWDRTTVLPVCGPLDSRTWQELKARTSQGPKYSYRIRGGKLLVTPTPTAGDSWYFEYVSENWISNSAGSDYYNRFASDTDLITLPPNLVLMGLRWRWKKEKGFDYAEDFRTYEIQVKNAEGRDGGRRVLDMGGKRDGNAKPGIFVPEWSLDL